MAIHASWVPSLELERARPSRCLEGRLPVPEHGHLPRCSLFAERGTVRCRFSKRTHFASHCFRTTNLPFPTPRHTASFPLRRPCHLYACHSLPSRASCFTSSQCKSRLHLPLCMRFPALPPNLILISKCQICIMHGRLHLVFGLVVSYSLCAARSAFCPPENLNAWDCELVFSCRLPSLSSFSSCAVCD